MDNEQVVDVGSQNQAPVVDNNIQSNALPEVNNQSSAPASEKTFTQTETQAIVAKEARKAAEKARAEAKAHYESQTPKHSSTPQNIGGIPQMTQEQFQEQVLVAAHNIARITEAKRIETDWLSTMNSAKQADPEFAQVYDELNIERHPDFIIALSGMDNKVAVVKELGENPSKFANILMLAQGGSLQLARKELERVSASIKANESAQKQPRVPAPLSELKPSNIGSDNGDMTVNDFRQIFRG